MTPVSGACVVCIRLVNVVALAASHLHSAVTAPRVVSGSCGLWFPARMSSEATNQDKSVGFVRFDCLVLCSLFRDCCSVLCDNHKPGNSPKTPLQ